MKLCVDCKHYSDPQEFADFGLCVNPKNLNGGDVNLIDGSTQTKIARRDPYELRHFNIEGTCGKEGHWWEEKTK